MSIAAHIVGTPLVALRQIAAAVILSAFDLGQNIVPRKALSQWIVPCRVVLKSLTPNCERSMGSSEEGKNYYAILGSAEGASQEEIQRLYKRLEMCHHPDRGGDAKYARFSVVWVL
jgi:DnaJ-domain-containing protein 1